MRAILQLGRPFTAEPGIDDIGRPHPVPRHLVDGHIEPLLVIRHVLLDRRRAARHDAE